MADTAALLFGLRSRVSRRQYLIWGFALAALKFMVDTGVVYAFTKKTWSPLGYVLPSAVLRNESLGSVPEAMHVVLAVLAMPFLWIGVTMSVRRAADAGASPWIGVGFLVPIFNYLTIAVLALLPTKREATWAPSRMVPYRAPQGAEGAGPPSGIDLPSGVRAALLGLGACISLGLAMLGLSVYGLGAYGVALFFATPFTMGAVSALIYNAAYQRSIWHTLGLALLGTVLTGSVVLLFAIEGVLCLVMAFPIAAVLSIVGALLAWVISSSARTSGVRSPAAMLMLLPVFALGEAKLAEPTLRHVTTTIEIDAPPEKVWPNVIGFSELPAPPAWIYRLGIAYPMRATIRGSGVGAVRHCEFSTGPFVEPITVWDEPRRLAFDVTSQPPSMTEWSPYQSVKAPHLEGYMVSKGGEFRLVPLAGGRTRLEGTTNYTLAIYPELYWVAYGEVLLHGIHARVLEHIKVLSEG